jgi:large subunit ribosomal protein L47
MKAIKQALTERFYAWEDARKLASADPTISVNEDGITYGNAEEDFEEEEEEESNDERKLPEAVYEPATIKDGEGRKKDITA